MPLDKSIVAPKTERELSEFVKATISRLRILGAGTRPISLPIYEAALSTSNLKGVTLYEPGALTIVARAGTPMSELNAVLEAENQHLSFEPMDHRQLLSTSGEPTIGGVVATNTSGSRRIQAGACRDSLIGVRFIDGAGNILKNGGRVMKNVTGYDLVKLMAGSYGTLGVISEVSFKVLPIPEVVGTLILNVSQVSTAVEIMSMALGSPYDISGAAFNPRSGEVFIRLEGTENSVKMRGSSLSKLLSEFDQQIIETDYDRNSIIWNTIRNVTSFSKKSGDVWRISVKPSDAYFVVNALSPAEFVLDWGGGLVWALVNQQLDVRSRLGAIAGHATLIRAKSGVEKKFSTFHPEGPVIDLISKKLREKFDPRQLFNQGTFG